MRFLCALIILIWHYQHFFFVAYQPRNLDVSILPHFNILASFYLNGDYAVQCFWCISGFIFFFKYSETIRRREISLYNFIWLRISRLYPLHLITLLLVAILQTIYWKNNGYFFVYAHNDVKYFFLNLFMASGWNLGHLGSFNGPAWSVSIEEPIYLLFFIFMYFVGPANKPVLVLFSVVLALFLFETPIGLLWQCACFFFAGGLTYKLEIKIRNSQSLPDGWIAVFFALLSGVVTWTLLFHYQNLRLELCLLVLTPLILLLQCFCSRYLMKVAPVASALGNLTYSSYLIHFPLQLLLVLALSALNVKIDFYQPSVLWAFITLCLFIAAVSTYYFEIPAKRALRSRFLWPHNLQGR